MVLLRLIRVYRALRRRKSHSLTVVLLLALICIVGNAVCFYLFDGRKEGISFADALWYSVISITTIGYGDYSASSLGARLGTIFFIVLLGLATFSVSLAMSIDWVTDWVSMRQRGMGTIFAKDHILIVNFPSAARVSQLIQELLSDPHHSEREIVIVTDQIDTLPFDEKNVLFVNGPTLERESFVRAKVEEAKMVIVLATSYADPTSDAVVASSIAIIDSLNPNIYIVAECLDYKHKMLFDAVNCNGIVFSMKISGNLLAQETQDPGVSQLVEVITSNVRGTTLYSTEVTEPLSKTTYNEIAKNLLDKDINMLCVNREEESLTSFVSLLPRIGDRVIYAASQRLPWPELLGLAGM
jgi:voltage-gated potassium channel